jgi:hypothetical protein
LIKNISIKNFEKKKNFPQIALLVCDSKNTAKTLYKCGNGIELKFFNLRFDFRFNSNFPYLLFKKIGCFSKTLTRFSKIFFSETFKKNFYSNQNKRFFHKDSKKKFQNDFSFMQKINFFDKNFKTQKNFSNKKKIRFLNFEKKTKNLLGKIVFFKKCSKKKFFLNEFQKNKNMFLNNFLPYLKKLPHQKGKDTCSI